MRRLLVLLLVVLALAGVAAARPAAAAPQLEGVLVVGVAGLRWSDVGPQTPALARLAATGAVGALSVKALPGVTCPADGWLTLGAGARAQAYGVAHGPCDGALTSGPGDVTRNAGSRDGAALGALGSALGGRVQSYGPGARLAVGGSGARQPLVVVDGGSVRGPDRAAGARAADAVVGEALARLPAHVDLLVVGLSEGPGDDEAHLHVAAASGPSFPRGALRSASTGRTPYVQLVDVAPTVLDLMGQRVPAVMDGQPWRVQGAAPGLARLDDLDLAAVTGKRVTVPFFVAGLGATALLLLALARRPAAARIVALTGTGLLGASYAADLLPWWRAPAPLVALLALSAGLAAAVALAAARSRHAVGLVCAAVAGGVALDLVTGAHLQLGSVAGYSALVAGRFSGIGNVAFGVYAAAALLAAALLPLRAPAVAAVGLVAVAVDGAPAFGSDVGGVLALLPAFVVLVLLRSGTRVSPGRLAAALLGAAALVTAFALADHARPADRRTHLGRFVDQVADGTAGGVLRRKAGAVLGLLFHSPVTALLPLVVAAAVLLVLRPPAPLARALAGVAGLRDGLAALGVACAIGFAVNDSGAAVPALALALAVPAVAALCLDPGVDAAGPPGAPTRQRTPTR